MDTSTQVYAPSYSMTFHADQRIQQRGIKQAALDLVLLFGDSFSTRDGCELFALGKTTAHELKSNGYQPEAIRSAQKIAAIVAPDGQIVTSYFCSRNTRKKLKRAA